MGEIMGKPRNTVHRATLATLRSRYREQWSRSWPFDDAYLSELWLEVQDKNEKGHSRIGSARLYEECLILMRETHEF